MGGFMRFESTDDVCKEVECGKGTCKPSVESPLLFECECDSGWKQSRPDHDKVLKFLPCIIPNCTLNFSCSEAAPPVQDKESQHNKSFFDPCHWSDCGGGTCNKTTPFSYKCECQEGYYNLLKFSVLPCFRDCALGMDCSSLGISVSNKSTSPPSSLAYSNTNGATAVARHNANLLIIVMIILTPLIWKSN
ncbi:hypothetical protein U1Q18_031300 [Sarracenia purpurea var. burkii]